MIRRVIALCVVWLLPWMSAWACGPSFPSHYLTGGGELRVLSIPRDGFAQILKQLDLPSSVSGPSRSERQSRWENTLQADLADLRTALRDQPTTKARDTEAFVKRYEEMRRAIKVYFDGMEGDVSVGNPSAKAVPVGPWYSRPTPSPGEAPSTQTLVFDTAPYRDVLDGLPREFAMYTQGTLAWYANNWAEAEKRWLALLDIPAAERAHRSVWAIFMIGKARLLRQDYAGAVAAFERTRALAAGGFRDSLGLASQSLGWQANAERKKGDLVEAIHHYIAADDQESLYWLVRPLMMPTQERSRWDPQARQYRTEKFISPLETGLDPRLTSDTVSRQVLTACALVLGPNPLSAQWVDQAWSRREGMPRVLAERLAAEAYRRGDMTGARGWLGRLKGPTPYGEWVRSKILLREGEIEEALRILRAIRSKFPDADKWYAEEDSGSGGERANGEIGVLQLGREDYVDALDAFLRANSRLDAAYVAERVLTVDELRRYVDTHAGDPDLDGPPATGDYGWGPDGSSTPFGNARSLLSRRLARGEQWEPALRYVSPKWKDTLGTYAAERKRAARTSATRVTRGAAFFEAAKIARNTGMEILGTEIEPDGAIYGGHFSMLRWRMAPTYDRFLEVPADRTIGETYTRESWLQRQEWRRKELRALPPALGRILVGGDAERKRVEQSAPPFNRRFTYRFLASDLMWRASKLLPDNGTTTALALYYGGTWISDRETEGANRFYADLVRRCRRLPLGQKADQVRWFPKNLSDADLASMTLAVAPPESPMGN